jgi:3'-phosphoadenosine 5'-phosphosulfate sulfotransferase (PAPS reductase)/FAD synthetase
MKIDKEIKSLLLEQKNVTIGFSLGKDSLACATILKKLGIKFIPFYFYHVPDLDFVSKQIEMYENHFNVEIIKMPHPMLYDRIRHQDFQCELMADEMSSYDFPKITFEDLISIYMDDEDIDETYYDVVGMRSAESFNRRKYFEKNGPIDKKNKKIYPIHSWKNKDVFDFLKENSVPLTKDYEIWNRSWDGVKYQFLFGVKKHYPNDYEKIKEFYPLIDLELIRYEFNVGYQD